jgi:hypothetical protein
MSRRRVMHFAFWVHGALNSCIVIILDIAQRFILDIAQRFFLRSHYALLYKEFDGFGALRFCNCFPELISNRR